MTSIRLHFPITLAITLILSLLITPALLADDWPQWRGPNRDGVYRETGILKSIPPTGLNIRWRTRIGQGYSGPVVAQGRVYVTDHTFNPEVERVLCLDETTGRTLWTHTYPVDYEHMEYGNGPRAAPTVHQNKVYTLGTQGHLLCLNTTTGKLLWQKDLAQDYNASIPRYGASAAPLVYADLLIVCVGAKPQASVVAFDLNTGAERWKTLDDRPAYAAPIIINRGGAPQAIIWTADNITSLNPTTGHTHWQIPWKTTFDAAQVVATPVLHKDRLLFMMAWNRGSMMLKLDTHKPAASVVWKTRSLPTTTMATPLFIDEQHFYSMGNVNGLSCLDANSGDEVWTTDQVAGVANQSQAHLTPNQNRVFLFNQRGQLICAKLSSEGYEEFGRTLLVEPTPGHRAQGPVAWAHPAYANKHVIARNDREIVSASLDASHYPTSKAPLAKSTIKSQPLSQFVGSNIALALDFSPDGQTLALGTFAGQPKLLDLATGEEKLPAPTGFRNNCTAIKYSPDGKFLAYTGGSEFKQSSRNYESTGEVHLWNTTTQTPHADLKGHTSKVTAAVFSPDGQTLATGSADQSIRLWNIATKKHIATLKGHTNAVWAIAYSPDGQTLASASWDKTVKLWNPTTGALRATLKGHTEEILSLAISPDAQTLATGAADWTVRLWDLPTQTHRATLKDHHGAIYALAFSSDSKTLATGSGDQTIKLWNTQTAKLQTTLVAHESGVTALAFSPDDQTLASAGRDDAVRLWKLMPTK